LVAEGVCRAERWRRKERWCEGMYCEARSMKVESDEVWEVGFFLARIRGGRGGRGADGSMDVVEEEGTGVNAEAALGRGEWSTPRKRSSA
jgi:hypothetical protein